MKRHALSDSMEKLSKQNYYYPVLTVAPSLLAEGEYTFYSGRIYYKEDGVIRQIGDTNFYFYNLTKQKLYYYNCNCVSKVCVNQILFNMVDREWVLFNTTTDGKCCVAKPPQVVCECAPEIPDMTVLNGNIDNQDARTWNFIDFDPSYQIYNSCIYSSFFESNLIRNIGSTIGTNSYGILTDFTDYVKFDSLPDGESIPVLPNHSYVFHITASIRTTETIPPTKLAYKKFSFPSYEASFEINSSGVINVSSRIFSNNQIVFIPVKDNLFVGSNTPETSFYNTFMIFVNQPEPNFVKLAYIRFLSEGSPILIQASVQVNIIKKQLSFTS